MSELILNEQHEYWSRGIRIPGVTEILKDVGIIKNLPFATYDRGRRLHKVNELFFTSRLDYEKVNQEEMEMLYWIGQVLTHYNLRVVATEKKFESRLYYYAGKIDNIAEQEKQYYVIDLKTGHNIEPWHKVQLSAYANLVDTNSEYGNVKGGLILYERKRLPVFLDQNELKDGFKIFESALNIYNFKRR